MRKNGRLALVPLALLAASSTVLAQQRPPITEQQKKTTVAIYNACFAKAEHDMAENLKIMIYPMLAAKNDTKTTEARDYVDGPFARELTAQPSPVLHGLQTASALITLGFPKAEIDQVVKACKTDTKNLPLPTELKDKVLKVVTNALVAEARGIVKRTEGELASRSLVSPFE